LAEKIAAVRGASFDDELRRETDPGYVESRVRGALFSFRDPQDFDGARILDFGCGAGSSTIVLARLVPRASLVGVELNQRLVELARERAQHHRIDATFRVSPGPKALPAGLGEFDYVVLTAVWEHLLLDERPAILHGLLDVLRSGGLLLICGTPHRWYPIEFHTTGLPLVNYLPRAVARRLAHGRRGIASDESWPSLLRRGIRGGSVREIRRLARGRATAPIPRQGSYGSLWFETTTHRRLVPVKALMSRVGIVPAVTLALEKL
jgi:SAM-dependent methyltransferase